MEGIAQVISRKTKSEENPYHAEATTEQASSSLQLDDLLQQDANYLQELYTLASLPSLESLKGDLRGRMLATTVLPSLVTSPLHLLARSSYFPWRGKSFTPKESQTGEGINRVFSDRFHLFRFTTSTGPSRAGNFDAIQLDYDHSSNPRIIRAIKDEIREIRPGLYLGQAYFCLRNQERLILYFGLSS